MKRQSWYQAYFMSEPFALALLSIKQFQVQTHQLERLWYHSNVSGGKSLFLAQLSFLKSK